MNRIIRVAFVLCTMLLFAAQAPAAQVANYTVAPFVINGPSGLSYLEKAIPSMLSTRLHWQGHVEPASSGVLVKGAAVASLDAAKKSLAASGAQYVVWGDVNVVGDDADVTVRVLGKDGKEWHKTGKSRVNDLVSTLQALADTASAEVFGRPVAKAAARQGNMVRQLNPDMMHNQTGQQQVYLNPQFRYQGAEGSRLRSPSLPFTSAGMEVADFNGDGKNEVALISDKKVLVYNWNEALTPLAEFRVGPGLLPLSVRSLDLNRNGRSELIVSTYDTESGEPFSYVLSMQGKELTEVVPRQRMFMNVVRLLPDFMPTLIGQRGDPQRIFSRGGVHELQRQGSEFVFGRQVELPSWGNIYNFAWLPGDGKQETAKLVMLNNDEFLNVYSPKMKAIHSTREKFSGASIGVELQNNMPGTGKGQSNQEFAADLYYIPMRMLVTDFDRNGQWELLVNKPFSIASQFFGRYRNFPECDIQALSWDGVGLSLLWKTRRIKGSVADFAVADVNNDGVLDLVVNLNTYPGAMGLEKSRTLLVAYPLDLESADPNTAPMLSSE